MTTMIGGRRIHPVAMALPETESDTADAMAEQFKKNTGVSLETAPVQMIEDQLAKARRAARSASRTRTR